MHILKRTLVTRGGLSVEHLIRPVPAVVLDLYKCMNTALNAWKKAKTSVEMCIITAILSFLKKNLIYNHYHFYKPISATLMTVCSNYLNVL